MRETGPLVEIEIERLAHGGEGVGRRADGKVAFVRGALPGERALVEVTREKRRWLRGRLASVTNPSPDRRPSDCRLEETLGCGGCGLRHVADSRAMELKSASARAEIEKLAGLVLPEPTLHAAATLDGWRRRGRFRVGRNWDLGFLARSSRDVVPAGECSALDPRIAERLPRIRDALVQSGRRPAPDLTVTIELDEAGDVFLSWSVALSRAVRRALEPLVANQTIAGVYDLNGHVDGRLWMCADSNRPWVRQPGTFAQACAEANRAVRRLLEAWTLRKRPSRLVDLFAGSGNFALAVAAASEVQVEAYELDRGALESLRESVRRSKWEDRVGVFDVDLRYGMPERVLRSDADTCVILDPPRAGARELVSELVGVDLAGLAYVSCEPATLARDLGELSEGYAIDEIHFVDMFPRTPHLETVVFLERVG